MVDTFFTKSEHPMPAVRDGGRVEVRPFLQSANQIVLFLDTLSAAFMPVKRDIDGNIKKLEAIYSTNPDKYTTFHAMVEDDIERGHTKQNNSATISLLWLKRALQFMCEFFRLIVADHESGVDSENLSAHCLRAYEMHIKSYHSWVVQKVFSVMSRAMPTRSDLLKAIALGQGGYNVDVILQMDNYVKPIQENIDAIQTLYDDKGLDYKDKV